MKVGIGGIHGVPDATSSTKGKIKTATATTINTGTDTDSAVTPDALASSKYNTTGVLNGITGSDLISNGTFASATTDWTATDATISSVAGGQSGNCLEITRTGGDFQYATQTLATVAGATYKATVYVKSGTSGNEEFAFAIYDVTSATNLAYAIGTSSGTRTQYTLVFKPSGTSVNITLQKNTVTAGTMLFDTATCFLAVPQMDVPVARTAYTPGGSWSSDTTLADLPGATFSLEAGRLYWFEAFVVTSSGASGGVKVAMSGTVTPSAYGVGYEVDIGGTRTWADALNTAVGATSAISGIVTIRGFIVPLIAGTFKVQGAQNASDATPTVLYGFFTVKAVM